jgi:hypothetical protein
MTQYRNDLLNPRNSLDALSPRTIKETHHDLQVPMTLAVEPAAREEALWDWPDN